MVDNELYFEDDESVNRENMWDFRELGSDIEFSVSTPVPASFLKIISELRNDQRQN